MSNLARTTNCNLWALAATLGALFNCGGDDNGKGGNNGAGGLDESIDLGADNDAVSCTESEDCPDAQVCHPIALICIDAGDDCEDNGDCALGRYCDESLGQCLPGTTGSPCDSEDNCTDGASCTGGICACSGLSQEQEPLSGALDIYFIFDRTASMGEDCDYQPGGSPPVSSKACFATYALPDYLINVPQNVDTRLAFQFMSLADDDCGGGPYSTPRVPLTELPLSADHEIIQAISDEGFQGGYGTHIEGALRGMAEYTSANVTQGREMIGVLMTDGDPNGCEEDISSLSSLIANHLASTGIRTFIIGMQGATDSNLEQLALAGGAQAHDDYCASQGSGCHFWNVGDGSGDAIASALSAIIEQSAPLPCEYDVSRLEPPPGESLDYGKVNVTLTENGEQTLIGQVPGSSRCPDDRAAWYYDNPSDPRTLCLCPDACARVSGAEQGARINLVVGCSSTVVIPME